LRELSCPGTILGDVVGSKIDTLEGGSLNIDADADAVGPSGTFTGAVLDTFGMPSGRSHGVTRAKPREKASSVRSKRTSRGSRSK
jgi:hypothetical protein